MKKLKPEERMKLSPVAQSEYDEKKANFTSFMKDVSEETLCEFKETMELFTEDAKTPEWEIYMECMCMELLTLAYCRGGLDQ